MSNPGYAQMVGDCVFLQGKFVEIGIAPNGGYGSTLPAPATYHPFLAGTTFNFYDPGAGTASTSGNFLGFVADYGRDGWTVGSPPYFGDFYLPGNPQEGWAIEIGGSLADAYIPTYWTSSPGFNTTGYHGGLSGTNTSYSSVGGVSKGVWTGSKGSIAIRQTTTLDTSKLYFTVNVILTNTSATPVNDIYYIRTVDPDNAETRGGGYTTSNNITYQLPDAQNKVLVSAVDTVSSFATHSYLGLGTKDCRAKCMIFNNSLAPTDASGSAYPLSQIFSESTDFHYGLGFTYVKDVGIGLEFNIGTIAPGDSTSFTYAYILNAAYIDSALDATQSSFLVNSYTFNSGDSINLCTYNFDSVVVSMGSAAFYRWKWLPDTLIANDSASSNTINVTGITTPLTYTITGVNVSGACDTVVNLVTFTHGIFDFTLNNRDTNICSGNSVNASITGPPLLNYHWSPTTGVSNPAIAEPVITAPSTTTYVVTASSASGCPSVSKSFTINVYSPPVLTLDSAVVRTCNGIPAQLNVYAAPGGIPYSYTWSPSATLNNATISNPMVTPTAPGDITYTVVVYPDSDALCVSTTSLTVHTIPDVLSIHPTDTMICAGHLVQVIGTGDPAFSYQWIPTAGIAISNVLNALITPDTSATYVVTATYALCPAIHDTLRLSVQPTPEVFISNSRSMCIYDTMHLTANVSPQWYSGYSYAWTPGTLLDDSTTSTVVFSGKTSSTMYVKVTTPGGCTGIDSVRITVFPGNFASLAPDNVSLCPHQSVAVAPVATAGTTYRWFPSFYLSDSLGNAPIISPLASQVYTIIATDVHGCKDTLNFTATVFPAAVIDIPDTVVLRPGDTYQVQSLTNCSSFAWFPPAGVSDATVSNPILAPANSTEYYVTATTNQGCVAQDSINVVVDVESLIATPNAFTPGGTTNSEFKILLNGLAAVNYFRIFDRWGNMVFQTTDVNQGWDGNYKGQPQPFGVYVYELQAVTTEGTIVTKHGNLTLIR